MKSLTYGTITCKIRSKRDRGTNRFYSDNSLIYLCHEAGNGELIS